MTMSHAPEFFALPDQVAANCRRQPSSVAVIDDEQTLTWSAFADAIDGAAAALIDAGVSVGDRVVLLGDVGAAALIGALGVLRAGAVFAPLSGSLRQPTLAAMTADADPSVVLASPHYADVARTFGRPVVMLGSEGAKRASFPALDATDACTLIYSSGTTSEPKGILHSHGARQAFALQTALMMRIDSSSRALITTPLHTNGTWMLLAPILARGGSLILQPRFDAGAMFDAIAQSRPTHAFLVPTQCSVVLEHPGHASVDWSSFECLITAGSPMGEEIKRGVQRLTGGRLHELWGQTEGLATFITPSEMDTRQRSVGRSMPFCDLRILRADGEEARTGEVGEIVGRSASLMDGYWKRAEETDQLFVTDAEGRTFFRSGDLGSIDQEGYLTLHGRLKDMFVSGGMNVFPIDIETMLRTHPEIADVVVAGVPDPHWGETGIAFVLLREPHAVSGEAIWQWARERLAPHQRIGAVVIRDDDFPRNTLGKPLKGALVDAWLKRARS